jgi:hypothetical protein
MTFAGPFWQAALAACSVVAVLVLPLVLPEFRRLLPGLAAAAILCVAAFKHGMVRQDGHADLTQVKLAAAALFLFASATLPRTRRLYAALAIASTMVAVIICHREPERFAVKADSRATLRREIPSLLDLVTWQRTWAELGPANRARLAGLDLDARFRQVIGGGTVDAYPTRIDTVRANGWKYQPRPVLQSFVAYTPELDRLNAEHIAGPHAADYVVLQPDAVDGRNLMFDDPLSLRALLDHYRVVLSGSAALLLERRVGPPRFRAPEPLGAAVTGWVRSTPVPQVDPGEAVMMKVDIQRTLVGRLWLTLFRGAPVHLQAIRKTSGRTYARVVRANLASGVLVSPIARDIAELAAYFSGSAGLEPVVSIDWWTPGPSEFENDIRIEWFRLRPYLPATRTAVTEPSVSRTDPSVSRPER